MNMHLPLMSEVMFMFLSCLLNALRKSSLEYLTLWSVPFNSLLNVQCFRVHIDVFCQIAACRLLEWCIYCLDWRIDTVPKKCLMVGCIDHRIASQFVRELKEEFCRDGGAGQTCDNDDDNNDGGMYADDGL